MMINDECVSLKRIGVILEHTFPGSNRINKNNKKWEGVKKIEKVLEILISLSLFLN